MKTREELLTLLKEIYIASIEGEGIPGSLLDRIEEATQEEE
jgi:hypothetical protein